MNDASLVRFLESLRDLGGDFDNFFYRNRSS